MFSQCCPTCNEIATGTFCEDEFCRRKFLLRSGGSRDHCPLHDPALRNGQVTEEHRLRVLRSALVCARCGGNLFGIKPEDVGSLVSPEGEG